MKRDFLSRTPQDKTRIHAKEKWQLSYWANELNISIAFLKKLVSKKGSSVEEIRKELKEIRLYSGQ
jgi:hypothetical protein